MEDFEQIIDLTNKQFNHRVLRTLELIVLTKDMINLHKTEENPDSYAIKDHESILKNLLCEINVLLQSYGMQLVEME